MCEKEENTVSNFICDIIDKDLADGFKREIHTRFPPEPNGYLHMGHAKAILINYLTAKKYGGKFNLRYDDTNPAKEDVEYVDSIYKDICWLLGTEPDYVFYGSDYFDKCYEYAIKLIKDGKAYVCDLNAEQMREYKGNFTTPGKDSPYRNRTIKENLELFEKMKNGEFEDGACTLRAKIDMQSPNMNMRDPAIYRIAHISHHKQGNKWCIYPLYDYAHPIQDALEGITHSLCSMEFEDHRPLYDWVVDNIGFENKPHQYEFAKINITNTIMGKRFLKSLIDSGIVDGWDDPRMPTLCGLRRRGYTPSSIASFIKAAGVSKANSMVEIEMLEHFIRDELNFSAQRRIAVLDPLKVVITNYPEDKTEYFEVSNNPQDAQSGTRKVPFTKEIFVEKSDFMENPIPKFFRLKPDGEVRLMGAYVVKLNEIVKDENGEVVELHCTADLETGGKNPTDGRKIKGTIHWVSATNCLNSTVMVYNKLFTLENLKDMEDGKTYNDYLNPDSLIKYENAKLEQSLANAQTSERFQFVRMGYFVKDSHYDNTFNSIVGLKDNWKK